MGSAPQQETSIEKEAVTWLKSDPVKPGSSGLVPTDLGSFIVHWDVPGIYPGLWGSPQGHGWMLKCSQNGRLGPNMRNHNSSWRWLPLRL